MYHDSTVAKILDLVTNATDQKAKVETLVSRLSKIYTPIVLGLAILVTLVLPLFGLNFLESLYRGLTFLVISCQLIFVYHQVRNSDQNLQFLYSF